MYWFAVTGHKWILKNIYDDLLPLLCACMSAVHVTSIFLWHKQSTGTSVAFRWIWHENTLARTSRKLEIIKWAPVTHNCSRNGAHLTIANNPWMFYTVNIKRTINAKLGINVTANKYKWLPLKSILIQVTKTRNTLILVIIVNQILLINQIFMLVLSLHNVIWIWTLNIMLFMIVLKGLRVLAKTWQQA